MPSLDDSADWISTAGPQIFHRCHAVHDSSPLEARSSTPIATETLESFPITSTSSSGVGLGLGLATHVYWPKPICSPMFIYSTVAVSSVGLPNRPFGSITPAIGILSGSGVITRPRAIPSWTASMQMTQPQSVFSQSHGSISTVVLPKEKDSTESCSTGKHEFKVYVAC